MPLTDSMTEVAKKIQSILETNKVTLGLKDIYYGDQVRIPRNPAACVETGEKTRQLDGAPRRTLVTMNIYVLVYHNALKAGAEGQREENDLMAEQVETLIHQNEDLDGLVIHAYCTNIEAGYPEKSGTIWQATSITVEATSKVMLPHSI